MTWRRAGTRLTHLSGRCWQQGARPGPAVRHPAREPTASPMPRRRSGMGCRNYPLGSQSAVVARCRSGPESRLPAGCSPASGPRYRDRCRPWDGYLAVKGLAERTAQCFLTSRARLRAIYIVAVWLRYSRLSQTVFQKQAETAQRDPSAETRQHDALEAGYREGCKWGGPCRRVKRFASWIRHRLCLSRYDGRRTFCRLASTKGQWSGHLWGRCDQPRGARSDALVLSQMRPLEPWWEADPAAARKCLHCQPMRSDSKPSQGNTGEISDRRDVGRGGVPGRQCRFYRHRKGRACNSFAAITTPPWR